MKPPVEHVRLSARAKDILIKVKRCTGLEHWNEICRIALCRSFTNASPPPKHEKFADSSIDIDWRTFAGIYSDELAAITRLKAKKDGVDISRKDAIAEYFRNHLERGISSMQNIKSIETLYDK